MDHLKDLVREHWTPTASQTKSACLYVAFVGVKCLFMGCIQQQKELNWSVMGYTGFLLAPQTSWMSTIPNYLIISLIT